MYSTAIKQQILDAIINAMHADSVTAYRGSLVGIKAIQTRTGMPNALLAIGIQHGCQAGVISTHRHDHPETAAAENMVNVTAWDGEHFAYYVCGVAIRSR